MTRHLKFVTYYGTVEDTAALRGPWRSVRVTIYTDDTEKAGTDADVFCQNTHGERGATSRLYLEYRKDKCPFHPSPTAADCCCIA